MVPEILNYIILFDRCYSYAISCFKTR